MALADDISQTVGIWSLGDFRPDMPRVSGMTALVHRLCVRLSTPRGRFGGVDADGNTWGWPNFGTDMAQYLLSKATPQQIASDAQAECLKDEQVKQANASVVVSEGGRTITLSIRIVTSSGPFVFTLVVTQAATDLISLQAA